MGAQTRTDVLPYISLIPVFGYLWPGTSSHSAPVGVRGRAGVLIYDTVKTKTN